jgi:hypothetical protein
MSEEDDEKGNVTPFTLVHFATGYVARKMGIPLSIWITIHIIFELWENSKNGIAFFSKKDALLHELTGIRWETYSGDSLPNSLFDTLVSVWGWMIADFTN